jgi:hypothetical protein
MRYVAFLFTLGFVAGVSGSSWAEPPGEVQKKPPVTPPRWNNSFPGVVTAVSENSITIRGIEAEFRGAVQSEQSVTERGKVTFFNYYGKQFSFITPTKTFTGVVQVVGTREGYTITDAEGRLTVIREQDQIPRVFKLCKELATGGVRQGLTPANAYRVQDVKIGDYVGIRFDQVDGIDTCTEIRIHRRPGGLVPPSPDDRGDINGLKYHEYQNAHNEWFDHGTPIPDKFLSPWALEERRAKIAPMPREVMPKIPHAEP